MKKEKNNGFINLKTDTVGIGKNHTPKEEPKQLTDLEIAIKLEEIGLEEPKKETAIEWLVQKYIENSILNIDDFQQAKEMEKQQIIDAHIKGHNAPSSTIKNWDAEQYYNETYNNENTNNN
jgi:hypothetical protein